jgi:ascorbate PTS system EIIB component
MSKKVKVLAVCGFGVGTSLILKMNIADVLKKNDIAAEVSKC